jgi:hypothetical protein
MSWRPREIFKLRTRVDTPKLRLISTSVDPGAGGNDAVRPDDVPLQPADTLLAQALPPEAHAALNTAYHQRQMLMRRLAANADRLRYAVVDLAAIDVPPDELIDALSPEFDQPIVRERLEPALDYLSRLAAEWRRKAQSDR